MLKRTVVGTALLALLGTVWWLDDRRGLGPAWACASLCALAMLMALDELLELAGARGGRRLVGRLMGACWLGILLLAALAPNALTGMLGDLLAGASLVAGACLAWQLRRGPGPATERLARSLWFAVPWVGGLGAFMAVLLAGGLDYVVGLVVVAKGSDIGGYFIGRWIGRRKLLPAVSPGKTRAGAVGGLCISVALALVLLPGALAQPPLVGPDGEPVAAAVVLPDDALRIALLGLLVGALAILSDLTESLVKRSLGAKDSGRTLGPSGGVLDLVDSLLLVGPLALAYTAILA